MLTKSDPGYSVIDFSLLDPHWGTTDDWRNLIDAIHAKGMYIMMDFTVGTMADYIGFAGHVINCSPSSRMLTLRIPQASQYIHAILD